MVCDTNHSFRRFLKSDLSASQNDSLFANLGNQEFPELSLCSIYNEKFIQIIPINPRLAFINWQIDSDFSRQFKNQLGESFEGCSLVLRIYDVTDIEFDGFNARFQFDIDIDSVCGCHYFPIDQLYCMLIAEVGLRSSSLIFFPYVRSNSVFFHGPKDFSVLYNSHGFNRFCTIQKHDKQPPEKNLTNLTEIFTKQSICSVAIFLNELAIKNFVTYDTNLPNLIHSIAYKLQKLNINVNIFTSNPTRLDDNQHLSNIDFVHKTSLQSLDNFYEIHQNTPFDCVQFHNWYSAPAAIIAASENYLPLVSVFHSLELERKSNLSIFQSQLIESWERKSIFEADIVLVSRNETKKLVTEYYGKAEERVYLVSDLQASCDINNPSKQIRHLPFNLSSTIPILLFAGELSKDCGADLIIDSLPNVCREFPSVQFVFAGEGELRRNLEQRAQKLSVIQNCYFTGHLESEHFDLIFNAAYVLLLPSRLKIKNDLIQRALQSGLTILATHQAQISGITHGFNGLIVYDNPSSVCWGIKELLSRLKNSTLFTSNFSTINSIEHIANLYSSIWMNLISSGKEA